MSVSGPSRRRRAISRAGRSGRISLRRPAAAMRSRRVSCLDPIAEQSIASSYARSTACRRPTGRTSTASRHTRDRGTRQRSPGELQGDATRRTARAGRHGPPYIGLAERIVSAGQLVAVSPDELVDTGAAHPANTRCLDRCRTLQNARSGVRIPPLRCVRRSFVAALRLRIPTGCRFRRRAIGAAFRRSGVRILHRPGLRALPAGTEGSPPIGRCGPRISRGPRLRFFPHVANAHPPIGGCDEIL